MSVAIAVEAFSGRDNVILNGFLVFCQEIGKVIKQEAQGADLRVKSTVASRDRLLVRPVSRSRLVNLLLNGTLLATKLGAFHERELLALLETHLPAATPAKN